MSIENENENIYYIPHDNRNLIVYAKRHIQHFIDFSRNGICCPEAGCEKGPFPDSKILFLHVLIHRKLVSLCGFCDRAFIDDKLLTRHFKKYHLPIYQLTDNLREKRDAFEMLKESVNNYSLWPTFINNPTISNYDHEASLVMVCQFPETSKFLLTEFGAKKIIRKCFGSKLITKKMKCSFIISADGATCDFKFESCGELVLHLITHVGINAMCRHCYKVYNTIDENQICNHMHDRHHECITCGKKFENMQCLVAHKNKINKLVLPYTVGLNNSDKYCALYFPNLAFHIVTMHGIDDKSAVKQMHYCLNLAKQLYYKINDVKYNDDIIWRLQKCFEIEVIYYANEKECRFEDCYFKYSNCREIIVHALMIHKMVNNFTYVCNICVKPFGQKNNLRFHLNSHDEYATCSFCLLSFKSRLNLLIHQHSTGHIQNNNPLLY